MDNTKPKFDHWAIVELMGHQKIAGRCTEENIAGTNLLRVDVPETSSQPSFTKYFGAAAIYAITPVDENTATIAAQSMSHAPITYWHSDEFIAKVNERKQLLLDAKKDKEDLDENYLESLGL